MNSFAEPNWQEPLDVSAVIARVPPTATVKGIFFRTAIAQAKAVAGKSPGRPHYELFTDYPSAELAQVLAECAQLLYPEKSLRLALRLLGHDVFSHLKSTTAGTFLFSVAGNNPRSAFRLVGRAYKLFSNSVSAACDEESPGIVVVKLRNIWSFGDCYHVGIFEGAVASYGGSCSIHIRWLSPCDIDIKVTLLSA
jgi:uncharacterized protein (TIGR02265 family)